MHFNLLSCTGVQMMCSVMTHFVVCVLLCSPQVAGLSNNIDFLVHCVRNEGFADKLVTTSFFDENIDSIFAKLHPEDKQTEVSPHNVFGLLGLVFADRTANGSAPSLTSFRPFVSGSCGDWRGMGGVTKSVNLVAGEVSKHIEVLSSGDSFSFVSKGEQAGDRVSSVIKSISKKPPSANASSDESVFDICAEIEGHRQNATVTIYRTPDGSKVVDGEWQVHFVVTRAVCSNISTSSLLHL